MAFACNRSLARFSSVYALALQTVEVALAAADLRVVTGKNRDAPMPVLRFHERQKVVVGAFALAIHVLLPTVNASLFICPWKSWEKIILTGNNNFWEYFDSFIVYLWWGNLRWVRPKTPQLCEKSGKNAVSRPYKCCLQENRTWKNNVKKIMQ